MRIPDKHRIITEGAWKPFKNAYANLRDEDSVSDEYLFFNSSC